MPITRGAVYHLHMDRVTINGQRAWVVALDGYQLAVVWDPPEPEYGRNHVSPMWLATSVVEDQTIHIKERGGIACGCQSDEAMRDKADGICPPDGV